MKALLGWSLLVMSLVCLAGCPEKQPEGKAAAPPSASAPAKGVTPAGW